MEVTKSSPLPSHCQLLLRHRSGDVDSLASKLGLEPTAVVHHGDLILDIDIPGSPYDVWIWTTEDLGRDSGIDEHLRLLVAVVGARREPLLLLEKEGWSLEMTLKWSAQDRHDAAVFGPDLLTALAALTRSLSIRLIGQ